MHKEMLSIGLGILAVTVPHLLPNISVYFAFSLFGVAALLVFLGAAGLVRKTQSSYAKPSNITIFNVTLRKRGPGDAIDRR